jgi:WD40 repeat protein
MKRLATISILLVACCAAIAQQLAMQTGHAGTITKIRFSPDGKLIASASDDRSTILWDLQTHLQSLTLKGHELSVNDLAFSSDSKLLATAGHDGRVLVWDVVSGKLLQSFEIGVPVKAVVFASDINTVYCAADYIYSVDRITNKKVSISPKSSASYNALAWSAEHKLLAFGGQSESVSLYSPSASSVQAIIKIKVNELSFSGKTLFMAGKTGRLIAYDIERSKKKFNKNSLSIFNGYNTVASANDYIFGGDESGLITVFKARNGKKKMDVQAIKGEVKSLTVSPDEKILACAGTDKRIVLMSSEDFTVLSVLRGSAERITNISFSADGDNLFLGYANGDMKLWNLTPGGKILYNSSPLPEKLTRRRWSSSVSNSSYLFSGNSILIKQDLRKGFRAVPDTIKKVKNQLISWDLEKNEVSTVAKTNQEIILSDNGVLVSKNENFLHPAAKVQRGIFTYIVPYFALRALTLTSEVGALFNIAKVVDVAAFGYSRYPHASKVKPLNAKGITNNLSAKNITINRNTSTTGKILEREIKSRSLSVDGSKLLTVFENKRGRSKSAIAITNLSTSKTIHYQEFYQEVTNATLSPSGAYFAVETKNSIALFRTEGSLIWEDTGNFPITFDPTESRVLYTNAADIICRNNLGVKVFQYDSHHADKISAIRFNPSHAYFATASFDGTVKFWDNQNPEEKVTLVSIGREEFIYITPQNYYYASKGALSGLGFRFDNKIFTFDQFDVKFNRPDLVISQLPYADATLLKVYQEAYNKRIALLGIDPTQVSTAGNLPEVKVAGLDKALQVTKPEFTFNVEAIDRASNLKAIHVLADGVPVFGSQGKAILNAEKGKTWKENLSIALTPGTNKIQVYAINEDGISSYKESFNVNLQAREKKPDLYLVAVGSSKFSDNAFDLNYASKDARDVEKLFRSQASFHKVYVKTLIDQEVTRGNVNQLGSFYAPATENDLIIFFFAGHGILDANLNYYLSTYNTDFSNPSENAIPYSLIDELMDKARSRKKLLFVDACHSGEVDKVESELRASTTTQEGQIKFRTVGNTVASTNKLGLKNLLEVSKNLFADLRKNNGATVIASAGGAEYAMEGSAWRNGIFTYCLLKGLDKMDADLNGDKQVTVAELRKYLFAEVPRLTGGKQSPTSRSENISNNFIIR